MIVTEVRWQNILLRARQVHLRLVVVLDLSLPSMQPIIVSVPVFVVYGVLVRRVLAWPWYVLHWLIADDPFGHDLFS